MPTIQHNPAQWFPQYRNDSHAIAVSENSRLLFISGLNGYLPDGTTMPDWFEEQGEIIWEYMGAVLKSARPNSHLLSASGSKVEAAN
jgi:2-iminobutanoate/2-iminopropanoate deaminase